MNSSDLQRSIDDEAEVFDVAGATVGRVAMSHRDRNDQLTWVVIGSGEPGGGSLVPVSAFAVVDGLLRVALPLATIAAAPRMPVGEPLAAQDEQALHGYYAPLLQEAAEEPAPDLSVHSGGDPMTMTRSEERLRVSTEWVPVMRAVLRRYVVTEQRTITVPVRREEVRVDLEPVIADDLRAPVGGAPPAAVMVLHEEQVEVRTIVVPTERVWLDVQTITTEQTVTAEVRTENIDLQTAPPLV